jgi:hypothetical protein
MEVQCLLVVNRHSTYSIDNKYNTNIHHSNIQPALNPVKLDPHLSPLGGETTSTPVSKFPSLWWIHIQASVKRFSDTANWNELKQRFQDSSCFSCYGQKTHADGMVSECEDHS